MKKSEAIKEYESWLNRTYDPNPYIKKYSEKMAHYWNMAITSEYYKKLPENIDANKIVEIIFGNVKYPSKEVERLRRTYPRAFR